jgi:hypothetical protein
MLDRIDLQTLEEGVTAPAGIVYSTSPRKAATEAGTEFFVKGPEPHIVFPELAGCLLAAAVGLIVAPVAVCCFDGASYCGSERVADIGRNVGPWLRNPARVANFADLFSMIVVDVWLANKDRNEGNVLVRPKAGGRAEFVMIDFEKSVTLGPTPTVLSPMVPPAAMWPTGDLGTAIRQQKPIAPPTAMLSRINAFVETPGAVKGIIDVVLDRFQPVDWAEGSVDTLIYRGRHISRLVGEVWGLP